MGASAGNSLSGMGEDNPEREAQLSELMNAALDPEVIGEMCLHAIQTNEFYILSHAEFKEPVVQRAQEMSDAFDRWAQFRLQRDV